MKNGSICPECKHEIGFKRNVVGLKKWLCGCRCHQTEARTTVIRTTTEVINDYQTVHRQVHGRDAKIVQKPGGWLEVADFMTVRPSTLAKMTDNLRKRL